MGTAWSQPCPSQVVEVSPGMLPEGAWAGLPARPCRPSASQPSSGNQSCRDAWQPLPRTHWKHCCKSRKLETTHEPWGGDRQSQLWPADTPGPTLKRSKASLATVKRSHPPAAGPSHPENTAVDRSQCRAHCVDGGGAGTEFSALERPPDAHPGPHLS